jgi:polyhydroxybutyrate depolymerase
MRVWMAGLAGALLVLTTAAEARAGSARAHASAGCTSQSVARGRRLAESIEVDGRRRDYILDVPDSVRPRAPVPLLFDFHGFGHSGAGVWKVSEFRDLAARASSITVYPEGLPVRLTIQGEELERPGWEMFSIDDNRDLAFVRALLDDLERRYCIDTARVYATGFSNGAFFSALLGCTMADRFAAVAPVSGGPLRVACTPARGVPILIQHGRQDPLIPVDAARTARDDWITADGCDAASHDADGPACTRWNRCRDGAVVEYCEGDFAHRWPPEATERIWKFLRAHPLSAK